MEDDGGWINYHLGRAGEVGEGEGREEVAGVLHAKKSPNSPLRQIRMNEKDVRRTEIVLILQEDQMLQLQIQPVHTHA